jgi:hypothetical protein
MALPEITVHAIDSRGNLVQETLKFDGKNAPIFDEFLSNGTSLEHGIYLLDELWRTRSLYDFTVLQILDRITAMRLHYDNKVAIVNLVVGIVLDMWSKKGHFYQMDNILNNIKTIQSEVLAEALKNPNRETHRIEEMNKAIEHLTARDARAAQMQQSQGRR